MLRVVERVMGEGRVNRDQVEAVELGYSLSVYREWTQEDDILVPRGFVVEGHLLAESAALEPLVGMRDVLTLTLEDGRRLDFYLVSQDGTLTAADDRGLYSP